MATGNRIGIFDSRVWVCNCRGRIVGYRGDWRKFAWSYRIAVVGRSTRADSISSYGLLFGETNLASLLSTGSHSFRKVLLIEYPRKGIWTVCFQTGPAANEIQTHLEQESLTVFVPTTPNPTSGFIMIVAKEDTRELDMDIETALKLVMSLGIAANTDKSEVVDSSSTNP